MAASAARRARASDHLRPAPTERLEIRSDPVKGRGIFAREAIAPGMHIVELYADATRDRELAKTLKALVGHLRTILTTPEPIGNEGDAWMQWEDPFPFLD